jgi:hypothetical protein
MDDTDMARGTGWSDVNICSPGNCICDAREWPGDTDCFGNTEEDDERIMSMKTLILAAVQEWDDHNKAHRHCYYDEADDAGTGECPSRFPTLRDWLEVSGFELDDLAFQIYGRSLDEPNFRSKNESSEFPVADSGHGQSIRQLRAEKKLTRSEAVQYGTKDALRERAERARKAAMESEQEPWAVEAMDYFKDRLDRLNELVLNTRENLAQLYVMTGDIEQKIGALAESVGEQSEPVHYNIVFDVKGAADEIAEAVEKAINRQAVMSKRIQRVH